MGVINLSFRNSFGSQNRILDSNILCASGLSGSYIMTNEVTVITGASSGIGAALAKQLGCKGHQLVLAARREKQLKEVGNKPGRELWSCQPMSRVEPTLKIFGAERSRSTG